MAEKNYMTREMDDARKVAEAKDSILKLLNEAKYSYRNEVAEKFDIVPFTVDDYAKELQKAGFIYKQGFSSPGFNFQMSITDRGRDFINRGGFMKIWDDDTEMQIVKLKKADEVEQAARSSDAKKLTIEQEKLSVSQKQLTIARRQLIIAIVLGAFGIIGYFTELIESRNVISRIGPIEQKVQAIEDGNILNRLDYLEMTVHKINADTLGKK